MTEERYCVDCKWFSKAFENGGEPDCWHFSSRFALPTSPVFGPRGGFHPAEKLREPGRACGPDGLLFEPREVDTREKIPAVYGPLHMTR